MSEWLKLVGEHHPEAAALLVGMALIIAVLAGVIAYLYLSDRKEIRRLNREIFKVAEKNGNDLREIVVTNGTRIEQMRQSVDGTNNILLNKLS